jgi:DNA-directed RNA polymerase subunit RPC12/RpoP
MEKIKNVVIKCPHCDEYILLKKLNCGIFRHGTIIKNGKQINPHSTKEMCEYYIKNKLIYGCGKPFKVIINDNSKNDDDKYVGVICEYI